jgi:hypothetical protein
MWLGFELSCGIRIELYETGTEHSADMKFAKVHSLSQTTVSPIQLSVLMESNSVSDSHYSTSNEETLRNIYQFH